MNKALGVLVAVVAISGCAYPQQKQTVRIAAPYNSEEAMRLLERGQNTIRGSALIRQSGGGVVTCAGKPVFLVPATAYATERARGIYGSDRGGYQNALGAPHIVFEPNPSAYLALTKKTVCDSQGYFKFDHVADGSFYVCASERMKHEYWST